PADGIRARSRRGAIGDTWWSQRFIGILEGFELGGRLARGRNYARQGQVLELSVEAGGIRARVQGSRPTPYAVSIRLRPLPEKDWARVEAALASRAAFLAKLLAGEMPTDIEAAFAVCRHSLLPTTAPDLLDSFYDKPGSLPQPIPAQAGSHPDAVLLELEDPPVDIRGHSLTELLRPAYPAMSDAARQRITGPS